jgi:hypothetical protein
VKTGLVSEAALEALDLVRQTMRDMRTEELGDKAVLAQYAQHRGDPQRILAFTAQQVGERLGPAELMQEAARYETALETLWQKRQPKPEGGT